MFSVALAFKKWNKTALPFLDPHWIGI